jgi:hypothetical protein
MDGQQTSYGGAGTIFGRCPALGWETGGLKLVGGLGLVHQLRHFYASSLLADGVDIRTLAEYLGHSDPGFTLRTYTHRMPSGEDRARRAVDRVFGAASAQNVPSAIGPRT